MSKQARYAFDQFCVNCPYRGLAGCAGAGMCRERFLAGVAWDRADSIATAEDIMLKAAGNRELLQGGTMAHRIISALEAGK